MEEWRVDLEAGRHEAAWDAFLSRYRRLVFATIRHYLHEPDDVMDAFTWVCEGLRQDDLRRLKAYDAPSAHKARFTTWLVVVVRRLCIDWLRSRNGRARPRLATTAMPDLHRWICEEVFGRRRSHAEAFEVIRSRDEPSLTFPRFLKELAAVYRAVMPRTGRLPQELAAPFFPEAGDDPDRALAWHGRAALEAAMKDLPDVDRVAVEMYVVDGVPAADVARVLGLAGSKAVYNRVYRALAALRERLESAGLAFEDL